MVIVNAKDDTYNLFEMLISSYSLFISVLKCDQTLEGKSEQWQRKISSFSKPDNDKS